MRTSTIIWIGFIIGLLLLIGSLINAHATDKFEVNPLFSGWDKKPTICLHETNTPQMKYYILHAADAWERVLNDYGIYDYDYNIKWVDTLFDKECDGLVVPATANELWKFSAQTTEVGATLCGDELFLEDMIGRSFYKEKYCIALINYDYQAGKYAYDTVVHEIGHILGLGHRLPIEMEGMISIALSNDMMMPQAKSFLYITEESIDALQYFYGYNGWNGFINSTEYIIPHE